jgi:hypothetical protein
MSKNFRSLERLRGAWRNSEELGGAWRSLEEARKKEKVDDMMLSRNGLGLQLSRQSFSLSSRIRG